MTTRIAAGERQLSGVPAFLRAVTATAWIEYKALRYYPSNLWLAGIQELTSVGVWYFVALFLSPAANHAVTSYGGNYVAYVLVGVLLNQVGLAALKSPFTTLSQAFWDKRLETYRLAVQGIWANLVGRILWNVGFSTLLQVMATLVLVATGAIPLAHGISLPTAFAVWVLLVAANAGLGLMGASLFFLLEVKTGQDPITWAYQYLVQLVSGLYIPLVFLPGWLRAVGQVLPQTLTFDAMRLLVLSGAAPAQVLAPLEGLLVGALFTVTLGVLMMQWALKRAERTAGLGVVV